ncbi:MAG TPA: alkaline phosphatase family protein [Ramlibacter sp.]|nr:alkaline phosphatase family protein [Ramlibacter sp.]
MASSFLARCTALLVLVSSLAGCAAPSATATPHKPRLVVFFVIDGLPQRQVTAYRDQLAPDGFARFLDRGAWFTEAHHGHAFTVTAAGHAAVLTGASPHRSGIIGNEWLDPATGAQVYNSGDVRYRYIGNRTDPLDGTSPLHLKAETVGDVLRRLEPRSKVVAISGKDRGAILPAGRSGTAYMYMDETGQFASSTYYMPSHPAWVDAFNGRRPADRYFRSEWKRLLPEQAYQSSVSESEPWIASRGGRNPMPMSAPADEAPGPAFYDELRRSPFIDALALDFARAAIAGEQLGRDDAPDILSVSLSGHDYVNHAFSAESRLSHDHFLHLDRMLEAFFRDLDATVGRGNYLALLTADHGFTPAPEYTLSRGGSAGHMNAGQSLARVNAELVARFGPGRWVRGYSAATLLLNRPLLAERGLDADTVAQAARTALLADPAVEVAYTRRELLSGSRAGAPYFEAMRKAWHPEVSGEIQYALKPGWMWLSRRASASHGSPYRQDTHVPILVYGPPWVKPGRVDTPVQVVDIAPTLSGLLGVPVPASSEGKQLPLPR